MIVSDIYAKIGFAKPIDEVVVANKDEYYNGVPLDSYGNTHMYTDVKDIVNDNGKLIILI